MTWEDDIKVDPAEPTIRTESRVVPPQEFSALLDASSSKLAREIRVLRERYNLQEGDISEDDLAHMIELMTVLANKFGNLHEIIKRVRDGQEVPIVIESTPNHRELVEYFDLDRFLPPDNPNPTIDYTVSDQKESNIQTRIVQLDELPELINQTAIELDQELEATGYFGRASAQNPTGLSYAANTSGVLANRYQTFVQVLQHIKGGQPVPVVTRDSTVNDEVSFFYLLEPLSNPQT